MCARLSFILSFRVHVKLFYRIVSCRIVLLYLVFANISMTQIVTRTCIGARPVYENAYVTSTRVLRVICSAMDQWQLLHQRPTAAVCDRTSSSGATSTCRRCRDYQWLRWVSL